MATSLTSKTVAHPNPLPRRGRGGRSLLLPGLDPGIAGEGGPKGRMRGLRTPYLGRISRTGAAQSRPTS